MDKLVLLDSNSLLNKAFYAIPPLNSKSGQPTNAVLGYLNMLIKIIKDVSPTHIIATFDVKAPTFRKLIYADYKAQRKPMPEELASQLPLVKEMLTKMNISIMELAGYEADDVIGTLAKQCEFETIIVTGDKDSLQLISDTTTVMLAKRGISEVIEYTPNRLLEDGLTPSQIIDLKSLMGDASDNIPGVAGVGEKTAMNLLAQYGNLDNIYGHIEELKGAVKQKLENNKETAYLSYRLATINVDVPIEFLESECLLQYPFDVSLQPFLEELNFKSALSRMEFKGESAPKVAIMRDIVKMEIDTMLDFDELIDNIKTNGRVAIYLSANSMTFAINENIEYTVKQPDGFLGGGIDYDYVIKQCRYLACCEEIVTIFSDSKAMMHYFGLGDFNAFEDISIKAYLLDATKTYKDVESILIAYGYSTDSIVSAIYEIDNKLSQLVIDTELDKLYRDVELPLVNVLYSMEKNGIMVDKELMNSLSEQYSIDLKRISNEIYNMAGENFNINSPQQLSIILFDKLNLKHGKKNKTGNYSTNVDILESLKFDHPIIDMILEYRSIAKLQSTYIIGLESLLDINNRLHTNFKQNLTATGRLSSTEPNLQNIPIRKPEGRKLRKMFIASPGNKLVAADYSQIELRLLAHFSADDRLCLAYRNNEDIHRYTASLIFHIPFDSVSNDMRSRAKAVNFGIIYGISDFGLASDVGCSLSEAKDFISSYFETYPMVKKYLDSSVEYARNNGYVKTILGRIRYIPDIKSGNANIRNFAERVAMNMPLQGSASDIIKLAMVSVYNELCRRKLKAKLLLQVHDELLIDCPVDEVEIVSKILNDCMENAVQLLIPLIAEVKMGDNWYETK